MKKKWSKRLNHAGKQLAAAGKRAPYDKEAINLLKNKQYLAWILKDCVSEFSGMEIDEIIPCIDTPKVGTVPVEPGLTNSFITGELTESKIIKEGIVTYDIRFTVRVPGNRGKMSFNLLIDLELQQKENPGYDIVSRGVLYGGRMLSEQMGREVTGDDYDKLHKVYSIWICMNSALSRANTITRYFMGHDMIAGSIEDNARADLIQVIVIRLPGDKHKGKPANKPTKLMELLSATFSRELSAEEKLEKVEELGIQVSEEMRGQVNTMCNLSQGIYDEGVRKGVKKGVKKGRDLERSSHIERLLKSGRSPEEISEFCEYPLKEVYMVNDSLKMLLSKTAEKKIAKQSILKQRIAGEPTGDLRHC